MDEVVYPLIWSEDKGEIMLVGSNRELRDGFEEFYFHKVKFRAWDAEGRALDVRLDESGVPTIALGAVDHEAIAERIIENASKTDWENDVRLLLRARIPLEIIVRHLRWGWAHKREER